MQSRGPVLFEFLKCPKGFRYIFGGCGCISMWTLVYKLLEGV